ncbi:hypothetical protein [Streptomyces triticiradicis]|uniref:Uncharacterized protein n=1 Tax=Streptomyces triticiradicis TaxID=2651189 RepID=A0A7J5DGX1_9ACTN|nr:hypothetical protein [Streptomyces triticiradicis]KAB1987872.1 hypothetical protein F8144_15695 [Streptomyces triticiradicis]
MEQRIGSKSQPLDAAAVNPAYIPGLTSPVPAEPKDAAAETEETVSDGAVSDGTVSEETASDEAPAAEAPEEAESEEEAPAPDGPVFEASDRRASIRADHSGVVLRLDDQEAEFRWDEIGAVETETPRFGKRFTITVHTPERRWYPIEIEANARARFKEWEEQLDAVLDAYFEDGEDGTGAEAEVGTAAEPEPEAKSESEGKSLSKGDEDDQGDEGGKAESEKP